MRSIWVASSFFCYHMLEWISLYIFMTQLRWYIGLFPRSGTVEWKGMWLKNFNCYHLTASLKNCISNVQESPSLPSFSVSPPNSESFKIKVKTVNHILICTFKIMSEVEYIFIVISHLYFVGGNTLKYRKVHRLLQ